VLAQEGDGRVLPGAQHGELAAVRFEDPTR
jgi:hypothetical protein